MRILVDDTIKEFNEISTGKGWGYGNNPDIDAPTAYWVDFFVFGRDELDFDGYYVLDGTAESYRKAEQNYKFVLNKLLKHGFCEESDFENFEFNW